MLPPLILTGGPAVGKSTTARRLAQERSRAAVIDVDDVRQLVVAGHAAPWEGHEGRAQHRLGVVNACHLARRFVEHGFEVVLADVLTPDSAELYRAQLPDCLVVRMTVTLAEARRRASTRATHLTEAELEGLHAQDRQGPPPAQHCVDVTLLAPDEQVATVAELWRS